jgi:hypothetical protein
LDYNPDFQGHRLASWIAIWIAGEILYGILAIHDPCFNLSEVVVVVVVVVIVVVERRRQTTAAPNTD